MYAEMKTSIIIKKVNCLHIFKTKQKMFIVHVLTFPALHLVTECSRSSYKINSGMCVCVAITEEMQTDCLLFTSIRQPTFFKFLLIVYSIYSTSDASVRRRVLFQEPRRIINKNCTRPLNPHLFGQRCRSFIRRGSAAASECVQ